MKVYRIFEISRFLVAFTESFCVRCDAMRWGKDLINDACSKLSQRAFNRQRCRRNMNSEFVFVFVRANVCTLDFYRVDRARGWFSLLFCYLCVGCQNEGCNLRYMRERERDHHHFRKVSVDTPFALLLWMACVQCVWNTIQINAT